MSSFVTGQATYVAEVLSPEAAEALNNRKVLRFEHNGEWYEITSLSHKIGGGDETTVDLEAYLKTIKPQERLQLIEQAKAVIDALNGNGFTGSSFTAHFTKRYQHEDTIGNRILLWEWPVEETPITLSVTHQEEGKKEVTTFKPKNAASFETAVKAPSEQLFVRINRVVQRQLHDQQLEELRPKVPVGNELDEEAVNRDPPIGTPAGSPDLGRRAPPVVEEVN
jgi:hypothetical protein